MSSAKYYIADVRIDEDILSMFVTVKLVLEPVNVLVSNATSRRIHPGSMLNTTTEEFGTYNKINLFDAFWSLKCVLLDMLAIDKGTIHFIGAIGSSHDSRELSSSSSRALCQAICWAPRATACGAGTLCAF